MVWHCARRIADVWVNFLPAPAPRAAARLFLAGRAAVAGSGAAAGTVLIAGQLRHQQAQRQARLAMLGEDLAALTLLVPPAAARAGAASAAQRPRRTAVEQRPT
ncbi:hypothetical protein M8494_30310 [Serratia ureilytica]